MVIVNKTDEWPGVIAVYGGGFPGMTDEERKQWSGTVNQDGEYESAVEKADSGDDESNTNYKCTACENEAHIDDYQERVQAWCEADCDAMKWHQKL